MILKSEKESSLVSVIVPAYNVEPYIEMCVSSILNQTYKNIEIIVIDDGSVDKTGELADRLAECDGRVRVIHKNNGGVSAARNDGIEAACGEYIVFVDGDDYLARDCVEYMLSLAESTGADFCLSKCCYTKKDEAQTEKECRETISSEEATALLLSPEVIVGCWNKIFKKSLLTGNSLRFSTDLFYGEGLNFIVAAAQLSNFVAVGNRKVYYYRRNNALSATSKFDTAKLYNGEKALETIKGRLTADSEKISAMLTLHFCMFRLGGAVRLKSAGMEKKYSKDYKRWLKYIRKNIFFVIFNKYIPIYRKLLLTGGCISPYIVSELDKIRRKRIESNSV